jgi:hypothetical protein
MAVSKRLRYEILRRDNHACRYCGATAPDVKLNVDHVIPQALGGSNAPTNLVASCVDCNAGKTSSMPNAMPVADVDQDTFRQAAAAKQDAEQARRDLTDHLWRGGYPPQWGPMEIEQHAVEVAWNYAWSVASGGGSPSHDQYSEFLVHSAALFEVGHSVAEVVCAAVCAGSKLTPHLSWGLGIADIQYAPISGEQYSRIDGVYDGWLEIWRSHGGPDPTAQDKAVFRGQLVMAARGGDTRENIQIASGITGGSQSADLDKFLSEWVTGLEAERAGGEF